MGQRIGITTPTGAKCANELPKEINDIAGEIFSQNGVERQIGDDIWEVADLNEF